MACNGRTDRRREGRREGRVTPVGNLPKVGPSFDWDHKNEKCEQTILSGRGSKSRGIGRTLRKILEGMKTLCISVERV